MKKGGRRCYVLSVRREKLNRESGSGSGFGVEMDCCGFDTDSDGDGEPRKKRTEIRDWVSRSEK